MPDYTDKIKSREEIKTICEKARKEGLLTVFTNGCFDILHAGHVRYLHQAKKAGDILIVGLNSDISVKNIKGENRPVNNENARAEVLAALECIDYITIFNEDTPLELIRQITPSALVKGADWQGKAIAGSEHVKSHGGQVILIDYSKGFSTSNIIHKIQTRQ